ncbi:uncharacterized protein BX664DRAFT_325945 [Halteromyces radiatus]|uniref:uncharacterized protein n=1 Tax=Halteromyces radiatus TaxID=101107 RepID=UPI00222012D5|nr:uncharacterized protein BX664DRAFT_325945 [Halteromyces radiatus]KAI8097254.1 hypothetical protein BX664DRAFT_325945 [Halteromyces radiatus]
MPRTILIAYDHSEASYKAVNWILDHQILLPEDKIYITTVLNDDVLAFEGFGLEAAAIGPTAWINDDCGERVTKLKEDATRLLETIMQVFKRHGLTATPHILKGDATDALVEEAEKLKTDMVIVGCNGRGFFKRQLLGSVSEGLTRNLKCTIMVVKP